MSRIIRVISVVALLGGVGPAFPQGDLDESLGSEVPLRFDTPIEAQPGAWQWRREAALMGLRQGFPQMARQLLQDLLEEADLPEAERPGLRWSLASACLALGDAEGAARALDGLDAAEPATALRWAMVDYLRRDYANAAARLSLFPPTALSAGDRAWYLFVEGLLRQARGDSEGASQMFLAAEEQTSSPELRAQFQIQRLRGELGHREASEDLVAQLRTTVRSNPGQVLGFEARRLLAMALFRLGRSDEAVAEIEALLQEPGALDDRRREELYLLLGLMLGDDSGRGRLALRRLLIQPADLEMQRNALRLLASAPLAGQFVADFEAFLDELIGRPERHALFDELLTTRASLAARQGDYEAAERYAERLLEEMPGSALIPEALRLLAFANWERTPPRYRTAASYLDRLRGMTPTAADRARVLVRMGDCFFLNGDYVNASEAYSSAQLEVPGEGLPRWLFQQVMADIYGDRLGAAAEALDAAESMDRALRWEAEYNLLDALRESGEMATAFRRLRMLLEREGVEALEPALQARLLWLEARLALDAGRIAEVPELSDRLVAWLAEADSISAAEKQAVESHALLLKAEALLRLGLRADGMVVVSDLRARFPGSGPEMLSFLMESRLAAGENSVVDAQQSLIALADRFPDSRYAPIALWEAALLAEQRGLDSSYREAMGFLDRLVTTFDAHPLVFYARLKQADLSRKLNDFGTALALYESILSRFSDHPERYRAELSRGDCLLARGSASAESLVAAAVVFDRLFEDFRVPPDAAVEAGYKWSTALRQRGLRTEAKEALFLVKARFFDDPEQSVGLGAQGRYWIARTLLDLAGLLEAGASLENLEQAASVYRQLAGSDLPGRALSEARLRELMPRVSPSP